MQRSIFGFKMFHFRTRIPWSGTVKYPLHAD